jgi:hypothetical protein
MSKVQRMLFAIDLSTRVEVDLRALQTSELQWSDQLTYILQPVGNEPALPI